MDLRIIKTKRAIRDAFLHLCQEAPMEKIKVKDVCEHALVNKSTFYKHYQDIHALRAELEEQTIHSLMEDFDARDCLFSDPLRFIVGFMDVQEQQKALLDTLFANRKKALFDGMFAKLMVYYQQPNHGAEPNVRLMFAFGGTLLAIRMLVLTGKMEGEALAEHLSALIQRLS